MNVFILNHYERLSPRVALEARSLKKMGNSITVINWQRNPDRNIAPDPELHSYQVKWITLKAAKGSANIVATFPKLYKEIWGLLKEEIPDIIHCTHFFLLPIAILVAKKKKCKVVYDAYERYAIDLADYYFPFLKTWIAKLIEAVENLLVRRVDGVLTISSAGEVLERRYRKLCRNAEVIYNVPSLKSFARTSKKEELEKKYRGRYVLSYVGGLVKEKGLFLLIDVLDAIKLKYPEVQLLLIGEFDSLQERDEFFGHIKNRALEKHVEVLPWLPYDNMLDYLEISHIGLAPHQKQARFKLVGKGTGRKFFTYMQAGIPVISTNLGEIAKVIEDENCGLLVDTTSVHELVEAVTFLLGNMDDAKKMGENGKAAILGKYNWEREEEKLFQVYGRLNEDSHSSKYITD